MIRDLYKIISDDCLLWKYIDYRGTESFILISNICYENIPPNVDFLSFEKAHNLLRFGEYQFLRSDKYELLKGNIKKLDLDSYLYYPKKFFLEQINLIKSLIDQGEILDLIDEAFDWMFNKKSFIFNSKKRKSEFFELQDILKKYHDELKFYCDYLDIDKVSLDAIYSKLSDTNTSDNYYNALISAYHKLMAGECLLVNDTLLFEREVVRSMPKKPIHQSGGQVVVNTLWGVDHLRNKSYEKMLESLSRQTGNYKTFLIQLTSFEESENNFDSPILNNVSIKTSLNYKLFWQKESLFNIAVNYLFGFTKFVFVDSDVYAEDPSWLQQVDSKLNNVDFVQAYRTVTDTVDADYTYKSKIYSIELNSDEIAAPGLAWGITRKGFKALKGIYDIMPDGSNDGATTELITGHCNGIVSTYSWYKKLLNEKVNPNIPYDYIPVDLIHINHGPPRDYTNRSAYIDMINFDIAEVIHKSVLGFNIPNLNRPKGVDALYHALVYSAIRCQKSLSFFRENIDDEILSLRKKAYLYYKIGRIVYHIDCRESIAFFDDESQGFVMHSKGQFSNHVFMVQPFVENLNSGEYKIEITFSTKSVDISQTELIVEDTLSTTRKLGVAKMNGGQVTVIHHFKIERNSQKVSVNISTRSDFTSFIKLTNLSISSVDLLQNKYYVQG